MKQKKQKKQMKPARKFFLLIIAAIALIVLVYQGYLTVRYRLHNGHLSAISEHVNPRGADPEADLREFTALDPTAKDIPGYALAAESETLRLYVEEETGNVALFDKRSGNITYAVHPDMKDDPIASDLNRSLQQSQVTIDFFTANRQPVRWNSYDHSVLWDQFRIESFENGLRITYTIGDISSPTGLVPVYISLERLEQVLAPLEGTRNYNRTIMRYVESDVAPGYMELIAAARTGAATLRDMNEAFALAGYTPEDYAADMAGSGVEDAVPLHFVIPMDLTLDGDSLVVNVDTAEIREYAGGRINMIQLMRGFGAGGMGEVGYLVVPNGSGSLIRFNNGKTYADEYRQYIYGQDPMLSEYATLGNIEVPRIPFFGIYAEGFNEAETRTILGRVESGDSQAYLTAGISEKFSSYNYVYPGFELRGSMSLAMFGTTGNESTLPIVERDMPHINLTVRYSVLAESGYSGMANHARRQLVAEGLLQAEPQRHEDIPFYMDIIGSAMGQKFFLGIRYMGQIPMTTYEQAGEIVADLTERGVTHQIVNYQGWFNRGYYHDVADKIKPVRQLGSVRELERLAGAVEAQGGKVYSDTNMMGVPFSSRRYNWQLESSRYYAVGMVGYWGLVNPITMYNTFSLGYAEVMHDALSPRFLTRYMNSYIKAFSRYDLTGTSLRDMGDTLASDRRRTGMIHREEAKEVAIYNLENLYAQGKPLMIAGGNLYALRFASDLINMPLSHNALYVVDEEIPLYQMIVHGWIDYAGAPINLSSAFDTDEVIVRLVEYGAAPHFAFTYEDASNVKYTGINWMYSTRYDNWGDTAATIYHAVNDALSAVSGEEIVKHKILAGGLRVVTYSNGVEIVVNRGSKSVEYEGETIPAVGFAVRN